MLSIIIWYLHRLGLNLKNWPRPWPWPQSPSIGLGLGLRALASASRFWPRLTSLFKTLKVTENDLLVLLIW